MHGFQMADAILYGVMAIGAVFGLIRGISGLAGSLVWIAIVLPVCYFLYTPVCSLTGCDAESAAGGGSQITAVVVTIVIGLVLATLGRFVAKKFMKVLIPQPYDAILGAVAGALEGTFAMGILLSIGIIRTGDKPGTIVQGPVAESMSIELISKAARMYIEGASNQEPPTNTTR